MNVNYLTVDTKVLVWLGEYLRGNWGKVPEKVLVVWLGAAAPRGWLLVS